MKKLSLLEGLDARVLFAVGAGFVAPVSPRTIVNQNAGWTLNGGAAVNLPYSRDSTIGNGGNGTDVFTKTITTTAAVAGKKLYLHFEGAYLTTSLSIDGTPVDFNPATPAIDAHKGGFQSFDFDVTAAMGTPGNHAVQVTVLSNNDNNIAPGSGGDYNRQGGIYRDVTLVAVDPTQVALTEKVAHTNLSGADAPGQVSGPGVRFSNDDVVLGATSATVHFTTVLNNLQAAGRKVTVVTSLVDAAGVARAQQSSAVTLAANAAGVSLTQDATLANPHLWDGRADPYLYTTYTEVRDAGSGKLLDLQKQNVGIRSFKISAVVNTADADPSNDAPFMLNGHAYRVIGVNMHQDTGLTDANGKVAGWSRTDAQARADVDLVADMGATAIRTSHYQQNQAFYDYCDKLGILVYTESPINGSAAAGDAFTMNAEDQYNELVRQNYNHASIFAWGFGNESSSSATLTNVFKGFKAIAGGYGNAAGLDPHRYTAYANYAGSSPNFNDATNSNNVPDILGTHPYTYWYGGQQNPAQNAQQPQGVTEYGGGGSAYQYTDNAIALPVGSQTGGVTTRFHPQNQQAQIEQRQYTELTNLGYLWGQFVWQMFDHADGKQEGDRFNNNDKGLATRDRVLKDSYFFYKASLNDPTRAYANQRVLYLSDKYWTARNLSSATVTVYSNVGTPTLRVNGVAFTMTPLVLSGVTIKNTYTAAVSLGNAANAVTVDATYADGKKYTDSAVWTYHAPNLAGTSTARVDFVSGSQAAAAGYVADNGGAYGSRNGATYGWLPAGGQVQAVGSAFSTGTTALTYSGLNVPFDPIYKRTAVWEYALPNGTYDVRIGAGQSGATDGVSNFSLEGVTAAIDTTGNRTQDVFFSRVTVTDGKLTLAAAPGAFNARITYIDINNVAPAANTAKPIVGGVTINNGGIQRSSIRQLGIAFNVPVTLGANAITLTRRGIGDSFPLKYIASADRTSYGLMLLSGISLITLPDGVFDLIVDATKVVGDNGQTMAGTYTFAFAKLFGDVNGDRVVDASDVQLFGLARNSRANVPGPGYRNDFDFDNDGDVDALDNLRFNANVGKSLTV